MRTPRADAESFYVAHQKIYPREIEGRFAEPAPRRRVGAARPLLRAALAPMERPAGGAVRSAGRKFYIFGLTLWPQDFIFLTWLLIIAALSLFFFTAVAGPPVVRLRLPADGLDRSVPLDGAHHRRQSHAAHEARRRPLDARTSSRRKGAKQVLWVSFALWTGFTFVGFFSPIRELAARAAPGPRAAGRPSGRSSTASRPTATPASCASRCASTCVRTRASRARCSTTTR